MNKSEYFKQIWAYGKLVSGYSSLKIFGIKTAIVFERLNTEYNYAVGHDLLIQNYCFACTLEEIAQSVGLSVEEVDNAISELKNLYLIETTNFDNFLLVHLEIEHICNFISKAEKENDYQMWDFGLLQIQTMAFNSIEFSPENKKIIAKFINSAYEPAVDENGRPLLF